MIIKNILIIFVFSILSCTELFAHDKFHKVLNYKAPTYPPAARALRAVGDVTVTVVIDKDGKVTSSMAETGHPLLKQTCEKAAKEWKFVADKKLEKREAKITFVFFAQVKSKKDKVKFKKPYRLEIRPALILFNTVDY